MESLAYDLAHATQTGQFPFPGQLRDQPHRLQDWYRLALRCRIAAERGAQLRKGIA